MANKSIPQTVALPLEALLRGRPPRTAGAGQARVPNDDDVYALHKPDWPKGLRLMPQHFEAQDAYHERRTSFALGLLFDHPWGVADVTLNSDALQAGEIALRRFEGIFPDGTPISISGVAGSNALARSFETALRTRESADVYLGLLREVPGRPMVDGSDGSTEARRFARRSTTRPELGTGQNPAAVPWLRPNVRILFEGEPVEEYTVLRIARLLRAPKGRAVLDRKFAPAVIRLRASPLLQEIVQSLEQRLVETRAALAAQRRTGQEATKSDAARAVLLMMLGRMVPRVSELLALNVHPREAYSALTELAGALSPFGTEGSFAIPRFDFLELGTTFDALASQIHQILASITAARYRAVPITRHDEFLRLADLREPGMFSKEFLLTIRAGDPTRVRLDVPLVAKVGAYERIGALISAALPGVTLVAEPRRPAGLDVPAQTVCFRLDQQGEHWDEVMRRGSLGIYLPEPYQRGDLALFVKERGVLE